MIVLLLSGRAWAREPVPVVDLWIGGDVHLGAGGKGVLAPLAGRLGVNGIVNLEGPIGDGPPFVKSEREGKKHIALGNAPRAIVELRAAGVRVAGVANNHASDGDPQRTSSELTRAGVAPAGLDAGPAAMLVDGARVIVTAHDLERGVPATLGRELAEARQRGDILVATFHVTAPPSYVPTDDLERAVAIAVAAGATIVVAHGTHTLAPLERRGATVIAWGLGNLAFACDCTDEKDAIVLRVRLARPSATSPFVVTRACALPIDAGLHGEPARPSSDARGIADLLHAIGSPVLVREGDEVCLP